MKKVEDMVNAKRAWMNTKQHAASQTPKYSNPPVHCSEIRAEKSVSETGTYKCVLLQGLTLSYTGAPNAVSVVLSNIPSSPLRTWRAAATPL